MSRCHRAAWPALLLLTTFSASAHVISMSSGDFRIDGNRATYELRIPIYEIQHVKNPEKVLFESIRFSSRGSNATLKSSACEEDKIDSSYRCRATYEFPTNVEELEVTCNFHTVTVPNHVHLLRAYLGEKTDQAVFDFSNTNSVIKFRPPTAFEQFATGWGSGFARAFSSAAAVLFLACLALAARSRKELLWLAACFVVGEIASALIVPRTPWNPAPRFVDAALALTVAYLAVEVLTLPQAGQRWLVAAVLGLFHGLSYALYLTNTGYDAFAVLFGMGVAELLAIGIFALLMQRLGRIFSGIALTTQKIAASLLLVTGLTWFFLRLRA